MVDVRPDTLAVRPSVARLAGGLAVAGGLALALWYPLHFAESTQTFGGRLPVPDRTDSVPVYPAVALGGMLLTWGTFAALDRSLRPLTARRSLAAPLSSAAIAAAGVARFTYEYASEVPFEMHSDTGRSTTVDPTVTEIVQIELLSAQFVAVAAASLTVVGAVAARRGRRAALASLALPAGLLVVGSLGPWVIPSHRLVVLVVFALTSPIPFAVGYLGARPDGAVDESA